MCRALSARASEISLETLADIAGLPSSSARTHSQERLRNATSRLLAQLIPIG